mmetsp:Transcript_37076/g.59530  ORF Transcript_37076/g.59530 Transcript_37076/m.59530 type:complete len:490 (+) Transcript_37076:482-1951(+)
MTSEVEYKDNREKSFISAANDTDPYYNIKLLSAEITGTTSQLSVYARMWIEFRYKHKEYIGRKVRWPCKRKTSNPSWFTSRPLYRVLKDSGFLHIELYHRVGGHLEKNELLGASQISLSELQYDVIVQKEIQMSSRKMTAIVSLERVPIPPRAKFIFFARHGQSEWNAAKEDKSYVSMLKQVDHPLTVKGRMQAEEMSMDVEVAMREIRDLVGLEQKNKTLTRLQQERKAFLDRFLNARAIVCSPLCRAVQTAVIGLSTHPCVVQHGVPVTLYSDTREKRNFGGFDTTSKYSGHQIVERMQRKLAKVYPNYNPKHSRFARMTKMIKVGDATDIWWNTEAETKTRLRERLQRLLLHLRYTPEGSIIVVGHSHFFRVLIGSLLSEEFKARSPKLAEDLVHSKLDHCAIAATVFDFGEDEIETPKIEDFRFLFKRGKLLHDKKQQKDKDSSKGGNKKSNLKRVPWKEWHEAVLECHQDDAELVYGLEEKSNQ